MRQALRIVNALLWLAIWFAIAVNFNALSNPPRMMGEGAVLALFWFAIDLALRKRRARAG